MFALAALSRRALAQQPMVRTSAMMIARGTTMKAELMELLP
jgi:hypothetical protein